MSESDAILRGVVSMLRQERADMLHEYDVTIARLERFIERRREIRPEPAEHNDDSEPAVLDNGRPSRTRRIMRAAPADKTWTSEEMGRALQAEGHDLDLDGTVLNRRVASTFAMMADVERPERGRYRLVPKPGTNGGGG